MSKQDQIGNLRGLYLRIRSKIAAALEAAKSYTDTAVAAIRPDHTIEDKPSLGKLLVTLNPSTQNEAKYLVGRDPYTAPADPTFSPASGGSGNGSLTVTIACATSGATVKYSTDNGRELRADFRRFQKENR